MSDTPMFKPITVIAASAGTGKTYRLSREYLNGLPAVSLDTQADLSFKHQSGIIATTFTNKAADELLERVRRVLLNQGQWLAAQGVLSGYLGTVNSLCGRFLSEHAIDAGLSPDLTVIGEERLPAVFAIAVDSVIHEFADEMHGPATRLQLENWRQDVQRVIDYARDNNRDAEELEGFAKDSWESLRVLLPAPVEGDGQNLDTVLAATIETVIGLLPGPDDLTQGTKRVIENLSDINRRVKSGAHIVWQSWANMSKLNVGKGSREIIRPLVEAARDYARHPRLHDDVRTVIFGVFRCAAAAMQKYADYKKEHGLIDFVDQELLTLRLLGKANVRESLKTRAHLLLVDEFQDTSPIQLAIFLELAKLVNSSVWVGDEKQSIYGFRGSDPELMRSALETLVRTSGGSKDLLAKSYRSRPQLVGFTNALFAQCSQIKHITSSTSIIEEVDRTEIDGQNNALHVWWLKGKKQEQALDCLASGIADVLAHPDSWPVLDKRTKKLRPVTGADIVILCRTNENRIKAARALVAQGLTVATERDSLLETPECVITCAALRVLIDDSDTLAVAELINLLDPDDDTWLTKLLDLDGRVDLALWLEKYSDGDGRGGTTVKCLKRLNSLRKTLVYKTPSEVLESAINCDGILESIFSWGNIRQRLANLDSLRGIARTFEELCSSARVPATAAGLMVHLYKYVRNGGNQPANPDENGIHVVTYHKSKGLEWPMVILFDLDRIVPGNPFGVKVEATAEGIDPLTPLSGRSLRYWPWPFGQQKAKIPLRDQADRTMQGRQAARRAISENVRLLYVGMTRARDYLVFGCRNTPGGTSWLKCLTDEQYDMPLMTLSYQEVDCVAELIQGVPETSAVFSPKDPPASQLDMSRQSESRSTYAPIITLVNLPALEPYYLNPSLATALDFDIQSGETPQTIVIGERIPLTGSPEMRTVGDCVHAFLAADRSNVSEEMRLKLASTVIDGWKVDAVAPAVLPVMADRLIAFINATYPGATIKTEMPVSGRLGMRRLRGTIDMLIETDDGYVVIDHKTFPGPKEEWENRAITYAPQMALYRYMVEAATDKPVIGQYIHMPVVGVMVKLDCKLGERIRSL